MSDVIFMFLVFSCGVFAGGIAGAFIAAKREADEFDGGFSQDYRNSAPRARTTIYSKHVNLEDNE